MDSRLILFMFGCCAVVTCSLAQTVTTEEDAMAYLNKYGYLSSEDMDNNGMPKTNTIKTKVIRWFQEFVNITISGILDDETMAKMNAPRCGMVDMESEADMTRKKRYALGTRWDKTDLTWFIQSRTPDLPRADVDRILENALTAWSDVSALTFREASSAANADILINFYPGPAGRDHGDGNPFDGPGNVLAHAYFPTRNPIGGDAHFDDDETYTDLTFQGINLFQVAAHEFGHSLGLRHSQVEDALMYPYFRGYVPNFQLHSDDIAGIQAQYGENSGMPEERDTPSTPLSDCMPQISMVTRTQDGSAYFANGTHIFRRVGNTIPGGYPKRVGEEFPGLPENLDAALFYPGNGRTYFFKGSRFWAFNNRQMDPGYPLSISNSFPGLPNDLSSAFIWSGNGRIYFTKGNQYYRYTAGRGVDQGYPRPLSTWSGLPSTIDAAFQYSNSITYFFQGPNYYRFNDGRFSVDTGYPLNTATIWLGCQTGQLVAPTPTGAAGTVVPSLVAILLPVVAVLCNYL